MEGNTNMSAVVDEIKNADEEILKEIYGEIARYWCKQNICLNKYCKYTNL